MDLKENIARVRAQLDEAARAAGRDPSQVTLLAATKTQGQEAIRAAIRAGVTVCGENRVQELTAHLEEGAYEGAQVHFIGHLQTNKVKYVVGRVALIHSVSSEKLLRAIAQRALHGGFIPHPRAHIRFNEAIDFVVDHFPACFVLHNHYPLHVCYNIVAYPHLKCNKIVASF